MLILGIESSCDETAAALIEASGNRLKILTNIVFSQIKIHRKTRGVVPEVAARAHLEKILPVVQQAMVATHGKNLLEKLGKVDIIAATYGPGLITSLLVGLEAAKNLSFFTHKPLLPINHLEAHLMANWLAQDNMSYQKNIYQPNKVFPAIGLIVSGGHTELLYFRNFHQYKVLGRTRDDAAGECLDKVAKLLNLGYPGGPVIEKIARQVEPNQNLFDLPRPMMYSNNFDFSFSGLKTAVLYKLPKRKLKKNEIAALAAETQQAIVDVLIFKTINAAKKYKVQSIILSGGVAANEKLRRELKLAAENNQFSFFTPEKGLCTDNAAMVAASAYWQYKKLDAQQKRGLLSNWAKVKVQPNLSF
jgi:N6-L-threonylcarbamoyladenine synthase